MSMQVARSSKRRQRLILGGAFLVTGLMLATLMAPQASAVPLTVVDDAGADDEPGQKDLNFLTVDYGVPGATSIDVTWGWDDTATSGNNTRDACALFDTDGDGFANYSFCVIVQTNGTSSNVLYSCGDGAADKCTNPRAPIPTHTSTSGVSIVDDVDPFGVPSSPDFVATHLANNECDANPGCNTDDTVADTTIQLADVGGADDAFLLNVCSYPSGVPGSDPSDCVFTPNSGFLTIVKDANPDDDTDFVFNSSADSQNGASSWTINGDGSVQFISFEPGIEYDLDEVVPDGWNLDDASCELQTDPVAPTGIPSLTGVNNFTIQSGVETICTFEDSKEATITVTKVVTNDNGGTALPDDFNLTLEGDAVTSGVAVVVDPGTYTAGETLLAGYTFEGFTGDCDEDGEITVAAGENKTCTLTNNDQQATITVTKVVTNDDGGSAAAKIGRAHV